MSKETEVIACLSGLLTYIDEGEPDLDVVKAEVAVKRLFFTPHIAHFYRPQSPTRGANLGNTLI